MGLITSTPKEIVALLPDYTSPEQATALIAEIRRDLHFSAEEDQAIFDQVLELLTPKE